jgi:6-pyruvoyl-tetrahydropterin synthase
MKKNQLRKVIKEVLKEMTSSELNSVERHADAELDPIDIEFGNHFFDRLNDPRNGKEITSDELISFFNRLAKKKEAFISFIKRYREFVVKDKNSSINIPFVSQVNQALAKTIMRKPGFMTPDPTIALEEGIDDPVKPGILKDRLGKLSCSKVRAAKAGLEDKGTHYAKALQRYLNYHCQ